MSKYIFVTGGVCSGLGKGVAAASIGSLLESRGFNIRMIKVDPYINVNAGTMNPFQHGEVYVTDDGAETDLDLGNYSRFTSSPLSRENSITTGQIYQAVITKERKAVSWEGPFRSSPTSPTRSRRVSSKLESNPASMSRWLKSGELSETSN